MQVHVDIEFDELVRVVKRLPADQLAKLKAEIYHAHTKKPPVDLEALLLNGPVATKKQLDTIENNRKAINQWRTK